MEYGDLCVLDVNRVWIPMETFVFAFVIHFRCFDFLLLDLRTGFHSSSSAATG
jgi:hypothetical protein